MAEPFAPDPHRLAGLQGRNLTFYDFGRRDEKRAILAGLRALAAVDPHLLPAAVVADRAATVRLIETDALPAGTATSDTAPEASS